MNKSIPLLDHGYIRLIETWGRGDANVPEAAIIEAARQSTQGSFRGWDRDERLLRYLYEHKHSTPFEFAGMTIEIQAPIFVFREWQRHRTQSYSEMSARYEPVPDFYYLPTVDRVMMRGGDNKQAGSAKEAWPLTREAAENFIQNRKFEYENFGVEYRNALLTGIPKELARIGMPVGWYSRMRATGNLRNWLAFLLLRRDPAAQWEIREYANALGDLIVANEFPRTWNLFLEGVK